MIGEKSGLTRYELTESYAAAAMYVSSEAYVSIEFTLGRRCKWAPVVRVTVPGPRIIRLSLISHAKGPNFDADSIVATKRPGRALGRGKRAAIASQGVRGASRGPHSQVPQRCSPYPSPVPGAYSSVDGVGANSSYQLCAPYSSHGTTGSIGAVECCAADCSRAITEFVKHNPGLGALYAALSGSWQRRSAPEPAQGCRLSYMSNQQITLHAVIVLM